MTAVAAAGQRRGLPPGPGRRAPVHRRVGGPTRRGRCGITAPRRLLCLSVGEARADGEAAVRATVDGHVATVAATIAVAWPQSVRRVTEALRARVREDVRRITDVEVAHVDVDVVDFATAHASARRVQ